MSDQTLMIIWTWAAFAYAIIAAVSLLMLILLAPFPKTRRLAFITIWPSSWVMGAIVWLGSCLTTYWLWGLGWLIGGLTFLGLGVFPLALVAAASEGNWPTFWMLSIMMLVPLSFRFIVHFLVSPVATSGKTSSLL